MQNYLGTIRKFMYICISIKGFVKIPICFS